MTQKSSLTLSSMNLLKLHHHHHHHHHHHQGLSFHISRITLQNPFLSSSSSFSSAQSISHEFKSIPRFNSLSFSTISPIKSLSRRKFTESRVSKIEPSFWRYEKEGGGNIDAMADLGDLSDNGVVYRKTLRLVECSMFAAVSGLAYFLSNSLAIENYFGCFFALPIVISSMRWGVGAGRKTMVATAMLLLVLAGPVKALIYLFLHGLVGFTMGSLWRLGANWTLSIFLCTIVRALGAMGYVLISSFLIRENILALITINIYATLTYMCTAIGVNSIPSMNAIYAIFGTVLLLNCGFFVFLLHILYAIFLTRLGMKASLSLPRWLEKAM